MSDSLPTHPDAASAPARRDGFAGYALLASLTLLVLALLVADRLSPGPVRPAAPPSDRLVRIRIGGSPAPLPNRQSARAPAPSAPAPSAPGPARPQQMVSPDPAPRPAGRTHVVADGETLGDIARMHLGTWTRWEEIAKLNGLAKGAPIRKGQKLLVPPR